MVNQVGVAGQCFVYFCGYFGFCFGVPDFGIKTSIMIEGLGSNWLPGGTLLTRKITYVD
jgi:hypothetical protein